MKATIEIPDELYRRVKSRSALLGRSVREVTTELYRQWLGDLLPTAEGASEGAWIDNWVSLGANSAPENCPVTPGARQILSDARSRLDAGNEGR